MIFGPGLRVVIVNGKPGVGKTFFQEICKDILRPAFCEQRSTVDKIKEIAKMGGWDGEKTPEARKLLSDLKQLFTNYNDLPTEDVYSHLIKWEQELIYYGVSSYPHVFFIDDREPEHIEKLKKKLNAITVLIRRPGDEKIETSNISDESVFNYEYDYIINNDGGPRELAEEAQRFINLIFS